MGGFDYTTIEVGDRDHGGIMPMIGEGWDGVPPHWMVYFAVADGKVCVPPTDIPIGRFAVLDDPYGATFSVIRLDRPG